MNGEKKNKTDNNTPTKILFGVVIAVFAVMLLLFVAIGNDNDVVDQEAVLRTFLYTVGATVSLGLVANILVNQKDRNDIEFKKSYLKMLESKYKSNVKDLRANYKIDNRRNSMSKSSLMKLYSKQYDAVQERYLKERRSYLQSWRSTHRLQALLRTFWGWVLVLSLCGAVFSCSYSIDTEETENEATVITKAWNAEDIPIPHLEDSRRYVSNPDNVLTENTVNRVDMTMKRMEDSLGIESVVIVVNYIENDDPFRMAQDVGNKFGVGRDDRGIIIVIGYEDHSINISPGMSLEADLTDAECYQLEQRYVVPAMKAEQPDSAVIYLTEVLYSLLEGKDLPKMSEMKAPTAQSDESVFMTGYLLFFLFWLILGAVLDYRHEWFDLFALMTFPSNPFIEQTSTFVSTGGGRSFGGSGRSFGGGGFSGGSFSGGSFGGGGATSRW